MIVAVLVTTAALVISRGGSGPVSADTPVRVTSEKGLIFEGDARDAFDAASETAGFRIRRLSGGGYEPIAGYVPDGAAKGLTGVEFRYQLPDSGAGANTVTLIQLSGRQAAVSGGRADEPEPTPVDLGIAGVEAVQVDLRGGAVGYTIWVEGFTFHFGFYPKVPSVDSMEQIVRDTLSE